MSILATPVKASAGFGRTCVKLRRGYAPPQSEKPTQISAEFQAPSPQVPTRDCYFVRYCKKIIDGIWAVVDVSVDHLRGYPTARCRKRPSGCLIQEMPNGHSKVTWIEHVEADDTAVHSNYTPLVDSGLAFGAKRWIATLDREC